jgi:Fe-S-cluster containining protein
MSFDYPALVRFRCIKCGLCCGDTKEKTRHILLLKAEAEQIAKVTLKPISLFAFKNSGNAPYIYEMRKTKDGKCVFLEGTKCTIYSVRPLICRFYPFELKVDDDGKYTFFYTSECLGLNVGSVLSKNYFRKLFRMACLRVGSSACERNFA